MKNADKVIVRKYNGCEVTITFVGRNDKAMEEAKRLILESYYERINCNSEITLSCAEDISKAA